MTNPNDNLKPEEENLSITTLDYDRNDFRYYLLLEKDFLLCTEFVECKEDNYSTYSLRFQMLMLSCQAEIEHQLKFASDLLKRPTKDVSFPKRLTQFINGFTSAEHPLAGNNVTFPSGLDVFPFAEGKEINKGQETRSFSWWNHCNDLKHNRETTYSKCATLGNTVDCLSALFIIENIIRSNLKAPADSNPASLWYMNDSKLIFNNENPDS